MLFLRSINKSFSAKVFTYLFGAMFLITAILSLFYLQFQKKFLTNEKIKDGRILTSVLARNVRLGIFAENKEQISESLRTALSVEDVVGVCAYNLAGKLLYRETKPDWDHTDICIKTENDSGVFNDVRKAPQAVYLEDDKKVEPDPAARRFGLRWRGWV